MLCASFMLRLHALAVRPQLAQGGLGLSLTEEEWWLQKRAVQN